MARGKARSRDPERSQRWTTLVSEWRCSGVRQAAFCRERGLNANTFSYWKRRVLRQGPGTRRQRRVTEAAAGGNGFTPVRVLVSPACAIEVQLRGGHTIRIAPDFDETALRRLLGVLESNGGAGRAC